MDRDAISDAEIVVIEPHSDDAWLSIGQHLLEWTKTQAVTILTVYGDQRRITEAAQYADQVGAKHAYLGIPEAGLGLSETWTTELPIETFSFLRDTDALVVGPLGLRHPEHRAVVEALGDRRDLAYIELPYALTQANAAEVSDRALGREIRSWRVRSARANRAASIFRSQSMFWHYNSNRMDQAIEVLVR